MKKALTKAISICCAAAISTTAASVPVKAAGQNVVINEVCAKNTTYAAADGNFYDWIELYNPTSGTIDLSGYGLSDKDTNPYKYTFPAGTSLGAGQRLIVFCDSKITDAAGKYTAPMGLSTNGETITLTNAGGTAVDTITFGEIETNVSYGRVPDGSDEFAMLKATPGAANEKNNVISIDVPEPVMSQEPGFYSNSFALSIDVPSGCKVYYTLDGSAPTASSTAYSGPITVSDLTSQPNKLSAITDIKPSSWGSSGVTAPTEPVDKAFIINAVAVDAQGNYSDVVSSTYFIGYDSRASYYKNMKVISIVTDSDNLFDHEKGIYVLGKVYEDWQASSGGNTGGIGGGFGGGFGGMVQEWEMPANYTQKGAAWERQASMQIFDDGVLAHTQNVGLRIHGGATRTAAQKSFNVYARSEYGASKFAFDLFSGNLRSEATDKKIKEFDSFMLRNGGNDGSYTRFRDKLDQSLVKDRDMLTQAMEPAIVFINGEFWGHYEITEKIDEDFVNAHYKVGKKNVCIIKNEELDAGDEETFAEWEDLYSWVKSTDFSNGSNYAELCEKIDMQSFMDYMSAEIFFGNQDWGDNNTAFWKSTAVDPENPYADGRWRFILFDTEYSSNLYGQIPANTDTFSQVSRKNCFVAALLNAALKNDQFKADFTRTFMDMANENFKSERITQFINDLDAEYKDFVVDTRERFEPRKKSETQTPTEPTEPSEPATPGFGGGWGGIGGGGWGGIGGGAQQSHEEGYKSDVQTVTSYYASRGQSITSSLKSFCKLSGTLASITIKNDPSEGVVSINSLTPDFTSGSWTGSYYTDYPVILSVTPDAPFSYWELSDGTKVSARTVEIEIKNDMTVKAVYGGTPASSVIHGDVDGDESININDLVLMESYLLGKTALTSDEFERADILSNGRVDSFDLVALRKYISRARS